MITRLVLLFSILVALSACGFHLRGTTNSAAPQSVYVSSKEHGSPLLYQLRQSLDRQGIDTRGATRNALHLVLLKTKWRSQLVSIENALRSRMLRYKVDYQLIDKEGNELFNKRSVVVEKTLYTNDFDLLGTEAKARRVKQEMMNGAIEQIISQLRYIAYVDSQR